MFILSGYLTILESKPNQTKFKPNSNSTKPNSWDPALSQSFQDCTMRNSLPWKLGDPNFVENDKVSVKEGKA